MAEKDNSGCTVIIIVAVLSLALYFVVTALIQASKMM